MNTNSILINKIKIQTMNVRKNKKIIFSFEKSISLSYIAKVEFFSIPF